MKIDLITSMAVLWGATGMFIAAVQAARAADDDRDGDLPRVLTPSRLPQRLDEAPSTVTIIDRALIEASGARRLVDVLRLVPGFQVGYKTNNLPTATYHGLSDEYARRTLLLLNGQR
ncbi:MAG: TonB-dependent receptor plug domain-containing protein, partial [Candidatus Competibacter sp.]